MKYKKSITVVCAALCLNIAAPTTAHASIMELIFPFLRGLRLDPSQSLEAPFKDRPQPVDPDNENAEKIEPIVKQIDIGESLNSDERLDIPHRTPEEIGTWLLGTTAEVLTFETADLANILKSTQPYFDKEGRQQYIAFLKDKKMIIKMQNEKLQLRTVVMEQPLLINEGVVQGRYRWLYEVTTKSSYLKRGIKDYKNVNAENQDTRLLIQLGRYKNETNAPNDLDIRIERWGMR